MTPDDDVIELPADPIATRAAADFVKFAAPAGDLALAHQPRGYRQQLRHAIEARTCVVTVQVNVPGGSVHVLADGPGWPAPRCLLATEPRDDADTLPLTTLARFIVERALHIVAPDARAAVLAAVDAGDAALAVQADLTTDAVHVLMDWEQWTGPEELLTIRQRPVRVGYDA